MYNYDHDQVDDHGETDLKNIINEFRNFPWKDQLNKMDSPDVKSNPTIGIKDHLNDYDFGITALSISSNNKVDFAIYHSYKVNEDWVEILREGFTEEAVEKALTLFFERNSKELPKFLIENSSGELGIPLF